jgi:hypothetical protein
MTFQDAQDQFSTLVGQLAPGMAPDALDQISSDLLALQLGMPRSAEFSPIRQAIADFMPRLSVQMSQAVLADLRSRSAALVAASALLTQTATEASADARTLTFEQPKLIAAALTNAITTAQQLRDAIKSGNVQQAVEKAQAIETIIANAQATISATGTT